MDFCALMTNKLINLFAYFAEMCSNAMQCNDVTVSLYILYDNEGVSK